MVEHSERAEKTYHAVRNADERERRVPRVEEVEVERVDSSLLAAHNVAAEEGEVVVVSGTQHD